MDTWIAKPTEPEYRGSFPEAIPCSYAGETWAFVFSVFPA